MPRVKVLFVCDAHGLRSRVAEHFAREEAGALVEACCAAFEPTVIPSGAPPVKALAGLGMTFPPEAVPLVFDLYREGQTFDYVVTMCHDESVTTCPEFQRSVNALFQRKAVSLAWEIPDFRTIDGSDDEVRSACAALCEDIRGRVTRLCRRVVVAGEV
jgi:arsenate reductase